MPTEVLVVDDNTDILHVVAGMLNDLGYSCQTYSDAEMALRRIRSQRCDIVLADIRMPRVDGITLLKEIKRTDPSIDVVMMTAYDMDYSYVDVIEAGANDFILKPFNGDELAAKFKRILREKELKEELFRRSIHDSLTGLFNRSHLFGRLEQEVARSRRQEHPLSVILLDIDGFKEFNDAHGHLEGDRILAALGEVLEVSTRRHVDAAFRYGGDEFAVLLVETDNTQAMTVAERIRTAFEERAFAGCSLSLGLAQLRPDETAEDLIQRADTAMYQAKRDGGNRVHVLRLETAG
jgi:diguanylate cyclase (GGDEF)-like protein